MNAGLPVELRDALARLSAEGRRRPWPPRAAAGADFASNDYLGLARRPEIVDAARAALAEHGAGSTAARQLGGSAVPAARAERAVAEWLGAEAAILFPSGYQANLGAIGALCGRGDAVFSDALNHASLIDGVRLSRARVEVFAHLDLDELEHGLARARGARRRLVAVESVFSMDGDLAPLGELAELCARHDAWLVVDEAHSVGLLGPNGAGSWAAAEAAGADPTRVIARIVTGGKSLGVAGAFVVGALDTVEWLANSARAFLFTTASPPALVGALERAIEVAAGADEERERTLRHARRIAAALELPEPAGAIVPFVVGADADAVELARSVSASDLDVRAVRPPTVPDGTARLRLVAHAHNSDGEVERLVEALAAAPRPATIDRSVRVRSGGCERADVLCVVGTDTDIGKTAVSSALLLAAPQDTRYWKPVQTGAVDLDDPDDDTATVMRRTGLEAARFAEPLVRYALPASPHEAAAAAGCTLPVHELTPRLEALRARGPLLIELAGGLLVPLDDETTQADWLEEVRPRLVLVARSGLGTLNHTLLTAEALRARRLEPALVVLVGEPHPSNRATLAARLAPVPVIEMPRLDTLERAALEAWGVSVDLAQLAFGTRPANTANH
ncbi:8-amino-7-oxononanoate synthase 2 [Planctomycetes bacterium Pla163]|uniref:ATP-dependent dethiobiotin synthetase BioD n=1 Tax=Rohdeia mirabilis TaxID=2528008 RepID=A0A518D4K8_9BACT|nr:8-amino-7-oxononanoate synthase 2 [Planctomycetes bacterium Pla163]